MRSNPFYALSASAMLFGCYLLERALELEAGQLRGLLTLIVVIQLYEMLLVGLGAFLVRSQTAPRDGRVVLLIASVFLMNPTGLSAECVTIDRGTGALVTLAVVALAWLKLWWVRREAPEVLPLPAAALLGAYATAALVIPVVAMELSTARVLSPAVLFGLWCVTALLPIARKKLSEVAVAEPSSAPRAYAAWTWMPTILVVYQLWSAGYVHMLDFELAFVGPMLLGFAIAVDKKVQILRYVLPALTVGLASTWDPVLFRAFGTNVQPVHLAMIATGLVWLYLAWRDRDRWLAVISIGGASAILLGPSAVRLAVWLAEKSLRVAHSLGQALWQSVPRDSYGWGVLTVVAAFALLAIGAYRSLHAAPEGPKGSRRTSPRGAGATPAER